VSCSTIDIHLRVEVSGEDEAISRSDMLKSVKNLLIVLIGLMSKLVAEHAFWGMVRGGRGRQVYRLV
jgi:hypothetical protein